MWNHQQPTLNDVTLWTKQPKEGNGEDGHHIFAGDGNNLAKTSVNTGEGFYALYNWTLPKGNYQTNEDYTLTFTTPSQFKTINTGSKPLTTTDGENIGTYKVSGRTVTINFNFTDEQKDLIALLEDSEMLGQFWVRHGFSLSAEELEKDKLDIVFDEDKTKFPSVTITQKQDPPTSKIVETGNSVTALTTTDGQVQVTSVIESADKIIVTLNGVTKEIEPKISENCQVAVSFGPSACLDFTIFFSKSNALSDVVLATDKTYGNYVKSAVFILTSKVVDTENQPTLQLTGLKMNAEGQLVTADDKVVGKDVALDKGAYTLVQSNKVSGYKKMTEQEIIVEDTVTCNAIVTVPSTESTGGGYIPPTDPGTTEDPKPDDATPEQEKPVVEKPEKPSEENPKDDISTEPTHPDDSTDSIEPDDSEEGSTPPNKQTTNEKKPNTIATDKNPNKGSSDNGATTPSTGNSSTKLTKVVGEKQDNGNVTIPVKAAPGEYYDLYDSEGTLIVRKVRANEDGSITVDGSLVSNGKYMLKPSNGNGEVVSFDYEGAEEVAPSNATNDQSASANASSNKATTKSTKLLPQTGTQVALYTLFGIILMAASFFLMKRSRRKAS